MKTLHHLSRFTKSLPNLIALLTLLLLLPAAAPAQESFNLSDIHADIDAPLVDVKGVFSTTAAEPGSTHKAAVVAKISHGWHINSHKPYQSFLIAAKVAFDTIPGITPSALAYPAGHDAQLAGDKMSVYEGEVVIPFEVSISASALPGEYELPVRMTYQPCNDRECRSPQTVAANIAITIGEGGSAANERYFPRRATTQAAQHASPSEQFSAETGVQEQSDLERLIAEHGFWGYFLALGLAFITGVLLSFSPCTYPMIPITVSIFAGQERSFGRGFMLSLVYVGSMAFVYGIMGLIVSLVGGVFGAWLASPPVVIGIVIVFVIFSLSMFGLYELQVPAALRNKLGGKAGGGGIGGALLLGVIAALVVSPCVGPFVAGILLYVATSGSPVVGFLVLFVFALGLGTLYLIIGTFSSAISKLPGAGGWMEQVKKFFGFVLLLMAIFFLRTLISTELTAILTGALLLAFGVFGGGLDRLTAESGFFLRLKKLVGVVAFIIGIYLIGGTILMQGFILPPANEWLPLSGGNAATQREESPIKWGTELERGLQQAKAEGKPVLIDTWATWCANCRVLDKKTFHHPEVAALATNFIPIKVQLESSDTPITREFMQRFGLRHYSLPTTLLLDSDGNVKKILQGVVEPDEMMSHMRQLL